MEGTIAFKYPPVRSARTRLSAASSLTCLGFIPSGNRSLTFCWPSGINSRTGPFIIIGFVRLTRLDGQRSLLPPHGDVEHAGPEHFHRRRLVLMAYLLSSPMHVILCGRQKTVYATDEETEELTAVGVTMRAEGETPYEPHILIRMESTKPKKSQEAAQIIAYAEKDRTGVLAGRLFVNPTFETICRPLLSLLGDKQAAMLGGAEAAIKDAEELAKQEHERAAASSEILREFSARINLVKDIKSLKNIVKEITPQLKARMLSAHVMQLRDCYTMRDDELKGAAPVGVGAGREPGEDE